MTNAGSPLDLAAKPRLIRFPWRLRISHAAGPNASCRPLDACPDLDEQTGIRRRGGACGRVPPSDQPIGCTGVSTGRSRKRRRISP
jgi:hypothetical protein